MPKEDESSRVFRGLAAAELGEYTVLLYETWLGERDDPATQIEKWTSFFLTEDMPVDFTTAKEALEGTDIWVPLKDRYSYRRMQEFGGLVNAKVNEKLEIVKKTDRAAVQHQAESESLLPQGDDEYHNRWRQHADGNIYYEDFLAAIDRVADDESDTDAWKVIDAWRLRRLRQEERSL